MKIVELFTINRDSITVPKFAPNEVEFNTMIMHSSAVIGDDFINQRVTVDRAKVITVRNFTNSRNNLGEPIWSEQFIAIEPELRELLTVEERSQIESLKADIARLSASLRDSRERLVNWWSTPWYKRVFSALTGKYYERDL